MQDTWYHNSTVHLESKCILCNVIFWIQLVYGCMDSIFTIHLLILQGNLIGRAVVEYCEGGPQVGEKSLKQDFTELHAN